MSDNKKDLPDVTAITITPPTVAVGSVLLLRNPPHGTVPLAGQRNHPVDITTRTEAQPEQPNVSLERLPQANHPLRQISQPNRLIHSPGTVAAAPSPFPLPSSLNSARDTRVGGVAPRFSNTGGPRDSVVVVPFPNQNPSAPGGADLDEGGGHG